MKRHNIEELDRADALELERMRARLEAIANRIGAGKLEDSSAALAALEAEVIRPVRTAAAPGSDVTVICLAGVVSRNVDWLWFGRIPRGAVTLISGDPGLGKSTMTLDIAARVSQGAAMPGDQRKPMRAADVILMSAEDALDTTVRPRLDAASADVHRIHAITAMPRRGDPDAPPTFAPEDITKLETVIVQHRAALVVCDPFMAFLPSDIDSHKDQHVRRVLRPLRDVAERTGAAILIVRHLNKGSGSSAQHRGGGSIGIGGAVRAEMLVAPEPKSDEADTAPDEVCVVPIKSNLAKMPPGLRWRLVDTGNGAARIEWLGTSKSTADQLVAPVPARTEDGDEGKGIERVVIALRDVLAEGPMRAREAERLVMEMTNASKRTVERARAAAGVEAVHVRGPDGRMRHVDLRIDPASTPPHRPLGGWMVTNTLTADFH